METTKQVLELVMEHPQTIATLQDKLSIPKDEIQSIVERLENADIIKMDEFEIPKDQNNEFLELLMVTKKKKVPPKKKRKSSVPVLATPVPKRRTLKAATQRKSVKKRNGMKFKAPRLLDPNKAPQTTGGLIKKSRSRIHGIGKKRKLEDDSMESGPATKRRKLNESTKTEYHHPDGRKLSDEEQKEMDRLKWEEQFLMRQIEEIKKKQTEPKKKENVIDYDHLEELTDKWTEASQEMIHAIIKDKNDPDLSVKKVLEHFKIDPKMVRWNVEDEMFE